MTNHARYKLTIEQYEFMVDSQKGCCAICGTSGELVIDHCHTTGEVRKLLCRQCNLAIGLFKDDPDIMMKAIHYIKDTLIEKQTRELLFDFSAFNIKNKFLSVKNESKKIDFLDAVSEYIDGFISENSRLPKLTDITSVFGGSESNAFYAITEYIIKNSALLVSEGIVSREKVNKALIAYDKKPKGSKK